MTVVDLYNRDFSMNIGGVPITTQTGDPLVKDRIDTQLRVTFDVEKTLSKEPNQATITVYNLNIPNRAAIQTGAEIADTARTATPPIAYDWPLVIEAGYMGSLETIFSGNITFAHSEKEAVDWVTTIEAGDGENKYRKGRMNKSYKAGTTVAQVALDAAALLDVSPGNIAEKLGVGVFRNGYSVFTQGYVASGSAADILDSLMSSAGFRWSIQDGSLQVLAPTDTNFEEIVILSKDFGMVGSPQIAEKGKITVTSLLQGKLKPGGRIIVQSELVNGQFKVERVKHFGDTFGRDWYTEIEAKPAGLA